MTPKVKYFRKGLSGFIDETPRYVSWPNLVEIGRCEVAERSRGLPNNKNSRSAGLVLAPILPKMGRSRQKFPECCHPWTCPRTVYRTWCGSAAFRQIYSGKIDFWVQKVNFLAYNKNFAITNRSCVSCAHNTSRASQYTIRPV